MEYMYTNPGGERLHAWATWCSYCPWATPWQQYCLSTVGNCNTMLSIVPNAVKLHTNAWQGSRSVYTVSPETHAGCVVPDVTTA